MWTVGSNARAGSTSCGWGPTIALTGSLEGSEQAPSIPARASAHTARTVPWGRDCLGVDVDVDVGVGVGLGLGECISMSRFVPETVRV